MTKLAVRVVLSVALMLTLVPAAAPLADAADLGPRYSVASSTLARGLHCPKSFPRTGHKPVLLVHGTTVTDEENWGWNYAKQLPARGFDVCTVLMPNYALSDVQVSSEYVVYAVREMTRRAARKISVVGLSQGSLEPRWAIKWWPDIKGVLDDYVSMAGTNHGAAFGNAACASSCAPALWQQYIRTEGYRAAPRFLNALNAGDETPGAVSYTSVYSLTDPVIQPAAGSPSAALRGASNIAVQDICPGRVVEHVQSAWDAAYYAVVIDALTHPGPARAARVDRSACTQIAMPGVDAADAVVRTATLYAVITGRQAQYPKMDAEPQLAPYVVVGADAGRTTWGRATTKDGSRRFMLYEPPYTSGKRPLVVYLHGCSERPDSTAVASRYNELAKRFGFDVVYPEQPQTANGNHCWNWYIPDHQHRGHGEPGILAEVTRSVMSRRPIDRDRVFVTGVSAGGFMAVVMGATYPEVFAAVGAEAGGQYRGAPCLSVPCAVPPDVSGEWAYEEMGKRARQIPVFALVGDIDGVSPAENTERLIQQWLATNDWADDGTNDGSVDRQPAHSTSVRPDGGYPYEIDRYESRGCVIAERWLVKGMGHAHSGGAVEENYSDPKGPNAALASYRFFMDHPKPGGPLASCR